MRFQYLTFEMHQIMTSIYIDILYRGGEGLPKKKKKSLAWGGDTYALM